MEETSEETLTVYKRIPGKIRENMPSLVVIFLAGLFIVVFLAPRIFVTIYPGEAGVLFKRFSVGTVTDHVYPEGFYMINPFNKMYSYNIRTQTQFHDMEALTLKGLPISIKLGIRYHPKRELVGVLHKRVGPDYLRTIVIPEVESSVRALVGQFDPEQIYTTKRTVIEKVVNDSLEQVGQRFVKIDNVMVREISLPETIAKAIETKLSERERFEAYQFILPQRGTRSRTKEN